MGSSTSMNDDAVWKVLSEHIPVDAFSVRYSTKRRQNHDGHHKALLEDILRRLTERCRSVIWLCTNANNTTAHSTAVAPSTTLVAHSVAIQLAKENSLGGRFVCSSQDPKRQALNHFSPTIAYQLGTPPNHWSTRNLLVQTLRRDPALLHPKCSFDDQIGPLFHKPVRSLKNVWNQAKPRVFVFDRIDECCPPEEYDSIVDFFDLLVDILHLDDGIPDFHLFFASGPKFSLEQVRELFSGPSTSYNLQITDTGPDSSMSLVSFQLRSPPHVSPPHPLLALSPPDLSASQPSSPSTIPSTLSSWQLETSFHYGNNSSRSPSSGPSSPHPRIRPQSRSQSPSSPLPSLSHFSQPIHKRARSQSLNSASSRPRKRVRLRSQTRSPTPSQSSELDYSLAPTLSIRHSPPSRRNSPAFYSSMPLPDLGHPTHYAMTTVREFSPRPWRYSSLPASYNYPSFRFDQFESPSSMHSPSPTRSSGYTSSSLLDQFEPSNSRHSPSPSQSSDYTPLYFIDQLESPSPRQSPPSRSSPSSESNHPLPHAMLDSQYFSPRPERSPSPSQLLSDSSFHPWNTEVPYDTQMSSAFTFSSSHETTQTSRFQSPESGSSPPPSSPIHLASPSHDTAQSTRSQSSDSSPSSPLPSPTRSFLPSHDTNQYYRSFQTPPPVLFLPSSSPLLPRRHDALTRDPYRRDCKVFTNDVYPEEGHADGQDFHNKAALQSMEYMSYKLRHDGFCSQQSGDPGTNDNAIHPHMVANDEDMNPSSALYKCCVHWAYHLSWSDWTFSKEFHAIVGAFLKYRLLLWADFMVAVDQVAAVPTMLRTASVAVENSRWSAKRRGQIQQLMYDVERAVLEHRSSGSSASLSDSSIALAPRNSELRRSFRVLIADNELKVSHAVRPRWPARVLTIDVMSSLPSNHEQAEGDARLRVIGIAVSSDGTRLVSWEESGCLHLWDIITGHLVSSSRFQAPFTSACSHNKPINYEAAISFSSDSDLILLTSHLSVFLWSLRDNDDSQDSSFTLSSEDGPALCSALEIEHFHGSTFIVVGRAHGISTWKQTRDMAWVSLHSQSTPFCTTAVSVSSWCEHIMSSTCDSLIVHLRKADDLTVIHSFPTVPPSSPLSSLLCHMFCDDYALALWSTHRRQERWLSALPMCTSRSVSFEGTLTNSSGYMAGDAAVGSKSRSSMRFPFQVNPVYVDNRLVALEFDGSLYSRSGAMILNTGLAPESPLSAGSYERVATLSEDRYHIYVWDPSILAKTHVRSDTESTMSPFLGFIDLPPNVSPADSPTTSHYISSLPEFYFAH